MWARASSCARTLRVSKQWKRLRLPRTSTSPPIATGSLRVVKDETERAALAPRDFADAVPQVDAMEASRTLYRTMPHGKGHRVALLQRYDHRARLAARALFG